MARCPHGFEAAGIAGVKCPVGCHGYVPKGEQASESTQAQRVASTRSITNQQIVDALNERGTLNAAASHLGINSGTIINRGRSCVAVRDAIQARDPRKTRHSGFVDMTGWEGEGWKVLREAGSGTARAGALWVCEHSCGGVEIVEGTRLRNNPNKYCQACRPKRPGTVTRVAKESAHG